MLQHEFEPETSVNAAGETEHGNVLYIEDFLLPVFWAPRSFVKELQDATGNPELDACWDPCHELLNGARVSVDGRPGFYHPPRVWSDRGCWRILGRIEVVRQQRTSTGAVLTYNVHKYVDAIALNGIHGLPTHLGLWVGSALNESDHCKRVNLAIAKQEAHRKAFKDEHKRQDSWSDTVGNDSYITGLQRRINADKPTAMMEDQKKWASLRAESRLRDRERRIKEMGL